MLYAFAFVLAAILLALTVIDIKHFRLPDYLTFPLIGLGLLQGYVLHSDILPFAIGAVAGYAAFVLIEIGFKRLRGIDGLGRGDAKLLAAAGAWCGWLWLPQVVLIGSLAAIAAVLFMRLRDKAVTAQTAIPFGPFLAFGLAVVWSVQSFHHVPL
ncbi:A24 family peptidase [Fretibacter rubidus]|uniref:prepilin peptidase n=1 Tax=Fretibacter rubidus TaxID=570162 RepID=UPI00352AE163